MILRSGLTPPRHTRRFALRLETLLAALFALYGLLATALLTTAMPPYQNPDEAHHLFRAEQLSRLHILPGRLSTGTAGGWIDIALLETAVPFLELPQQPGRKATRPLFEQTSPFAWGRALAPADFPNTAIYPPSFYAPSVLGIWLGKATATPVLHTQYLARAATGLCATALAAAAIALSGGAALLLFALLTLPMTLALFASVSQDGMMIAAAALAAALLANARRPLLLSDRRFALLCLAFALICMARPPYAPMACLILLAPWRRLPHRAAALAVIAAATLAWSLIAMHAAGLDVTASTLDIDPKRQIATLLAQPGRILSVLQATSRRYGLEYLEHLVGRLGNLDVPLPTLLHALAWPVLAIAAVATAAPTLRTRALSRPYAAATLTCAAATLVLIFAIQYLTFSAVGSATVEGVQGRYFIPLLLLTTTALATPHLTPTRLTLAATAVVGLFPILSIAQMLRSIVLRFYL